MNDPRLPLTPLTTEHMASLGAPTTWVVPRHDGLDVEITAWKLGEGTITAGNPATVERSTTVAIWLTTKGMLLTERRSTERTPQTTKEPDWTVDTYASQFHATPSQALDWLKHDGKGKLGRASKAAWIEACRTFKPMAGMEIEREQA